MAEVAVETDSRFPIVGIGASAGGLQAIKLLFERMPADTGMAFVIVTHLPKGRESDLPEIIDRFTTMPAHAATADHPIEPNHVYVAPPDHIVTIEAGRLRLRAREDAVQRKPIDVFLSSLAKERADAAIGVLLSGSGNDGTLGMKAIKAFGGLTVAQGTDGDGPQHSEMPNAAIATGVVDSVLAVDEMAARLTEFARVFAQKESEPESEALEKAQPAICQILLRQTGHDFSGYKQRTFHRRVRRRMQVLGIAEPADYASRLSQDAEEVTLLFRDLLIGVTSFFRDADAFHALEELVIPQLFAGKGVSESVRVWVPGCATGEEAYSIAILLREHMDALKVAPKVQLFATDIDDAALGIARAGNYPEALVANLSETRLKRHFVNDGVTYSVSKEIREICVFSSHSVLRDPPFSRLELVSCRNLLIYLGTNFQARVIPIFHFALKPRGYLFLGTSENVGQSAELFAPVDKKQRIFQRRDHATPSFPVSALASGDTRAAAVSPELRRELVSGAAGLRRSVESQVIERYAPPHVLVNRDGEIVHYSVRTGKYLEPAVGLPNRQLIAMARKGLRLDLRAALREAVETGRTSQRERIAVEIDDRVQLVDLIVEPFGGEERDPLFLVLFRDAGSPFTPLESQNRERDDGGDVRMERLEQDLRETRERLQSTVEEYETAVEELKSSNEELQSVNEELQSTNEELETSKEELQSLNEELHTVNAELNAKVEELDRANTDLRNIFDSTQIATVFLDRNLIIRTFTPAVTSIFNLIASDRGRPLTDIASQLDAGDLKRDIQTVLERAETIERKVSRSDGARHYLMRILPYLAQNNSVEGILVTLVDVTTLAAAEAHQRTLVEELNHRVRNMLTVVNAIATQTLRGSRSAQDFTAAFTGRLRAMGTSFSLVSRENWNEVSLEEILSTQLAPFETGGAHRLQLTGPRVLFKPTAALSLGLVVHELATNAAKHGALSQEKGRLAVTWHVERDSAPSLVLEWREEGGPALKRPMKKGFGTELIERELHSSLGAVARLDFQRGGLAAVISIPLDRNLVSVRSAT
ncbi:MAG TPA: chemotaxis protein CheB [Candidatus Angelobacter sp.]|nr:chemotaxis protein CheB [Candidatus Angelobacter sp.]